MTLAREFDPDTGRSPTRTLAERYIETINRGAYGELGDLFAQDAVFFTPSGPVLSGRAEIAAFYTDFLSRITPAVRIASYFEDGDECVFELAATTVDEPQEFIGAIDHFTVGADGCATRLMVFTRPKG
jgi:ketosteroid isomerase-like protein